MTWGQVFEIINQLIDAFNSTDGAISESVTDGKIDYHKIVNRPKINGVDVVGSLTQSDLSISIDPETQASLQEMDSRVGVVESAENNQGSRIQDLEDYRTTDRTDIDELKGFRVTDRADINTLQSQRTTDSGRIDLLDERYSAIHTTQTSEGSRVGQLENDRTTTNNNVEELKDRMVSTINRLNLTARSAQAANGQSCVGEKLPTDRCISDIPNTFTFD